LLYRASRDGFKAKDFHSKSDGHSNTIVIIKVKNGDIIGGYTSVKWESPSFEDVYVKDDFAFLFSITKNKIYKIKENMKHYAIYISKDSGPRFGRYTLCIGNNNVDDKSISQFGCKVTAYESNGDDCGTFIGYPSSTIKTYFTIDDYEVYEVENSEEKKIIFRMER